jgi:3-deoxy-D-manno-octulosonic-acid transferase
MLPLYNFFVLLLTPFLLLYLLVVLWRRRDFRAGFWERVGFFPVTERTVAIERRPDEPCLWIHAVSVGEAMAAIALVRGLRARWPRCHLVFSTYTPAGRALVKAKCPEVNRLLYFPLDVSPIVEAVIRKIRPSLFVLVETDIWPTWVHALARRKVPAVMVNGRISQRRVFWRPFYRRVLMHFTYLCMQTEVDAERLIRVGVDPSKVAVTGNMKFALAASREGDPERLRREIGLPAGARVLIAGSTHPGEEAEILRCYEQLRQRDKELLLLVAPRHPERVEQLENLFRARGLDCVRRTRMNSSAAACVRSVILLDTIGELSKAYALGTFIFVGGSLVRRGGHNILEPASWGKPIFFGPYMDHYSGIADMLEREGAAIRVRSGEELARQIERLARNPDQLVEMGRKAALFVARNQGSLEKNLDVIQRILKRCS